MEVQGKKRSRENGPKAEKDQTERATGLGRRTRRGDIEKWDQTDSPEIPDRGEKSLASLRGYWWRSCVNLNVITLSNPFPCRHPGELSTACHICGKKFLNEANMRKHLRFHSGRNFPCKYGCDVVYPNVAELVKHLRALHPELPKKSQQVPTKNVDVPKKRRGRRPKNYGQLITNIVTMSKCGGFKILHARDGTDVALVISFA